MAGDLVAIADELQDQARLQAELAAHAERANRAEVKLRNASEDILRMGAQIERLEREIADAKCIMAKSHEEAIAALALATTRGTRAAELERELGTLREKNNELEQQVAGLITEKDHLQAELGKANSTIDETLTARNQLSNELATAAKQEARCMATAAAAEERFKADAQQLQVRLAASEAECRAVLHAKATLYEDLQRCRSDILALQGQLQDESRQKDECAGERRRLQRDLELVNESLAQAQRAQRGAVAGASELEAEIDHLRTARGAVDAELQANATRVQRLQEEKRQLVERNTELTTQLRGLSTTVHQLEAENTRLADSHAKLRVEAEAYAAEVRSARGEAAELAADRARLLAELHANQEDVELTEFGCLRDELRDAKSEVGRLQREVAANDAVLAQAEAALEALIVEKQGLQQQLWEAREAERRATEAGVVWQQKVAELRAQLQAVRGRADAKAELMTEASGSLVGAANDRMINYLQSLSIGDQPIRESGRNLHTAPVHPATTHPTPAASPPRNVTLAPVTASPGSAVRRYAPGPGTSESACTLPPNPLEGVHTNDWDAASASGWDNSATACVAGIAIATTGVQSATPNAGSLVLAAQSASLRAVAAQPKPTNLATHSQGLRYSRNSSVGPSSSGGADTKALLIKSSSNPPIVVAAVPSPLPVRTALSHNGMQAFGSDSLISTPAKSIVANAANTITPGSERDPFIGSLRAAPSSRSLLESTGSLTPLVQEALNSDACGAWSVPASPPQQPGREQTKSSGLPTEGKTVLGAIGSATAMERKSSALTGSLLSSRPSAFKPMSGAMYSAASSTRTLFAAAGSPAIVSGTTAAAGSLSSPEIISPTSASYRPSAVPASPAPAPAPEGNVALQSAGYRLSPRTGLTATGNGDLSGKPSDAAESAGRVVSIRPSSMGSASASGASPMLSPRVMLEARMLSRAVRPSAEALSGPLRSTVSTVSPVRYEQGPSVPLQRDVPYPETRALRGSKTLSSVQSAASQLSVQSPQQQPIASLESPVNVVRVSAVCELTATEETAFLSPSGLALAATSISGARDGWGTDETSGSQSVRQSTDRFSVCQGAIETGSAVSTQSYPPSVSASVAASCQPVVGLDAITSGTAYRASAEAATRFPQPGSVSLRPYRELLSGDGSAGAFDYTESNESHVLAQRLAAMDEALRAIGAT